jgi:hypothetical protein
MNIQPKAGRPATFAAAALAVATCLGVTPTASAHGGRGRSLSVSGPAAAIPAPATTYYGGFGRPATVLRTSYQEPGQGQPAAPAPSATVAPSATAAPVAGEPQVIYTYPPVMAPEAGYYPMGYVSPGSILGVQSKHQHRWTLIRFYRPYYP